MLADGLHEVNAGSPIWTCLGSLAYNESEVQVGPLAAPVFAEAPSAVAPPEFPQIE